MGRNKGLFIVVEGADGAGTTTMARSIERRIQQANRTIRDPFADVTSVKVTAEPSKGPIGMLIRGMLSRNVLAPEHWRAMSYLFMADRIQHLEVDIEPAVLGGQHVICDRYYPSTLVYQSADLEDHEHAKARMGKLFDEMCGVNSASEDFADLNSLMLGPDLFIFLDIDPEVALKRRLDRGSPIEMYEAEETQRRVVKLYRHWHDSFPGDKVRINANAPQDVVEAACWEPVRRMLEEREGNDDR